MTAFAYSIKRARFKYLRKFSKSYILCLRTHLTSEVASFVSTFPLTVMGDIAEDEDSRTASVGQKRSRPEEHLPHESTSPTSLKSRDIKRARLDSNADFVSLEDGPEEFNPKNNPELPIPTNGKQSIPESQSPLPDYLSPDEERNLQIHLTEGAQINTGTEPDVPSFDRSQPRPVEDQQLGWEVCLEPTPSLAKLATTRNDSLPSRNATMEHSVGFGTEAPPRVLSSLTESERHYQQKYWGLTEDYALARCPVCSGEGHMDDACPARRCRHCGVQDDHFSIACPRNLRCKRCKERGHLIQNCSSKLARYNADGLSCDLCRQHGHTEENCSLIWRTFDPDRLFEVKMVDRLLVSCYECGSDRHWGNDCLIRPRYKNINCDVFSAKYANRYLSRPIEPPAPKGGFSIKGRANQNVVKFPSNDDDDDPSAFYRKKPNSILPPRPLPHGNINIKTLNFDQRQGGGGNSQPSRQGAEGTRSGRALKEQRPSDSGRGNWQPPLPREPLPQRPAIPPSPQRKRKRPPPLPVPADSFRPRR